MTHQIHPDSHYVAGESVTWEFTIEEDGQAKDLSGATVSWYLLARQGNDNSDALISDSDAAVSADVVDAPNGRVDVSVEEGTTEKYAGRQLWQRLEIEGSNNSRQIWSGPFPVNMP